MLQHIVEYLVYWNKSELMWQHIVEYLVYWNKSELICYNTLLSI